MSNAGDVFVTVTFLVQAFCPREKLIERVKQVLEEGLAKPLASGNIGTTVTVTFTSEQAASTPVATGQVLLVSPTQAVGPFASVEEAASVSSEGVAIVPLYSVEALTWRREYDFLDARVKELLQQFLALPGVSAERRRDALCREIGNEIAELLMVADSFEDCVEWIQQHCGASTAVSVLSRLIAQLSEEAAQEE